MRGWSDDRPFGATAATVAFTYQNSGSLLLPAIRNEPAGAGSGRAPRPVLADPSAPAGVDFDETPHATLPGPAFGTPAEGESAAPGSHGKSGGEILRGRSIAPDEEKALKAAVKRALALGGGAASVQYMVGPEETRLSRMANPNETGIQAKISDAIEIDRQAGAPVIVSAMAAMLGYRLVAADSVDAAKLSARDLARIGTETSQFVAALADATEDDVIDAAERRRIDQEAEEAVAAIRQAQAKARGGSV